MPMKKKSGAGQYFTPRSLIDVIVKLIKPQVGELCNDPACGTFDLTPDLQEFECNEAFTGCELVHDTHRLALINSMLHGLEGKIILGDTLSNVGKQMKNFDVVLSNPPVGTKKGGERATRDDFTFSTSNKQLNFLQHIYRSLKADGKARAAVVLPDNVLFADGEGEKIRVDLMDKCNLHTILRLPTGIFYAQGVKTNVLFFTRGTSDEGNTQEVWFSAKLFSFLNKLSMTLLKLMRSMTAMLFTTKDLTFFLALTLLKKNNSLDLGLIRDDSAVELMESVAADLKSL